MSASQGALAESAPQEAPEEAVEATQESDALARVVAAAKQLEAHEEVDRWEFADDVAEAVDERFRPETVSGQAKGNRFQASGFYNAIDEVNEALHSAGVITVGRDSIVGAYATAKAWPTTERVDGATYWAHYELRTKAFDKNRKRALEKLVRASKTKVGPQSVRLWKSSVTPSKPPVAFLTKVEERTRSALNSAVSPGWRHVAQGDRDSIATMLRRIANEIANDTFPKKGPSL